MTTPGLPSAEAQGLRSASADRRARIGTPNAWGRPPGPWWPRASGLVRAAAGARHPDGRTADASLWFDKKATLATRSLRTFQALDLALHHSLGAPPNSTAPAATLDEDTR
jgi:hypothetical protein